MTYYDYICAGVGPRFKYGVGAGQLQKVVGGANVSSINHGYTDACLIGAAIKCDAASAGEVSTMPKIKDTIIADLINYMLHI